MVTWASLREKMITMQQRSQSAEKVSHIKGRQGDQAMSLFNCIPFQIGISLKGRNLHQHHVNIKQVHRVVTWGSLGEKMITMQWRSQNAEKVTHIKGRLLDQAVSLHLCPFSNRREQILSFMSSSLWYRKSFLSH